MQQRRDAQGAGGGTAVVPRPVEPTPRRAAPRRSNAGTMIVVGAVILAIAIIGLGFLIRSMISHERDSAERSRHIQERLHELRSGEADQP